MKIYKVTGQDNDYTTTLNERDVARLTELGLVVVEVEVFDDKRKDHVQVDADEAKALPAAESKKGKKAS